MSVSFDVSMELPEMDPQDPEMELPELEEGEGQEALNAAILQARSLATAAQQATKALLNFPFPTEAEIQQFDQVCDDLSMLVTQVPTIKALTIKIFNTLSETPQTTQSFHNLQKLFQ